MVRLFLPEVGRNGGIDDLRYYSLSTVFQSYQNDRWVIRKAICNGTFLGLKRILPQVGLEPKTTRPVLNLLSYRALFKIPQKF